MTRSYLWLLLCVTLWGSNFVFGSILLKEFPPLLLCAFRLFFSSIFLFGYAYATKRLVRITRQDFMLILLLGLVGIFLNQMAFFNGLKRTDATTASLILSLTPITTSGLAVVFLREMVTKRMLWGSLTAIIGVFFVIGKSSGLHLSSGVTLVFFAMLTFSISIILTRKLTQRLDPFVTTAYGTVAGSFVMIPFAFTFEPVVHASSSLWAWILLVTTAVVMQGICALIWNYQLRQVGAGKASIFLNLQPFVAMVLGFFLLGTTVSGSQILGSLLIISGVLLATAEAGKWKPKKLPAVT